MQVRTRRTSGRAHQSDRLSTQHGVTNPNVDFRQVTITGRQAVAMIDIDDVAITALPSGDSHFARGRNLHRRAVGRIDVLTLMIFQATASKRIAPSADAAFKFPDDGPQ